jgi:hypothetical protein
MRYACCLALFTGIGVLAPQGCGGGLCDYQKNCPNDPVPTQDQINSQVASCKAQEQNYSNQPCFGEAESWLGCAKGQVVCSSSGTTDGAASVTKAKTNCAGQYGNLVACCLRNSNSQVCKL